MTFDSIHSLLKWFIGREFLQFPKVPGNHCWLAMGAAHLHPDAEDVWTTYFLIINVLCRALEYRDRQIIMFLYDEERLTFKQIGKKVGCSARTIARIRWKVLTDLERECETVGLISRRYEEPKYLEG